MHQQTAIDTATDMSWDAFVIAVEDALLVETGEDLGPQHMHDIAAGFDAGMTPWGCALAIREHHVPRRLWPMPSATLAA